ncbi:hypothetical protein [Nostoc sp.]|uniref:hypothetical protein n=1 Tax=Nostoc sp. TaxID=1180 RepID=UPI002FF5E78A
MPNVGLLPQDLRQSRNDQHFQPEAGNEVLKGFELKLTPMNNVVPLPVYLIFLTNAVYIVMSVHLYAPTSHL